MPYPLHLRANMHEIVERLRRGDRLVGPVTVRSGTSHRVPRPFGFAGGGGRVNAHSVEALVRRGLIAIIAPPDHEREAVLTGETQP